jgi:heme exporter protein A
LFRGLAVTLKGGETLAVTGANGSGKSTFMRIVAGVMTPTRGQVLLERNGRDIAEEDRPLLTGFVSPYLNVYDGFTARENLEFIARVRRFKESEARIEELLELVSLNGRADDLVATYSSGMKQRVKFAAALLPRPLLMLLDEPSTNLDEAGIAMLRRVIEVQREVGGLLILATNNPQEATWCDRSIRIEDFC